MRGGERGGIVQPVSDHKNPAARPRQILQTLDLVLGKRTVADFLDSQRRRNPADLLRAVAGQHLRCQSLIHKLPDSIPRAGTDFIGNRK